MLQQNAGLGSRMKEHQITSVVLEMAFYLLLVSSHVPLMECTSINLIKYLCVPHNPTVFTVDIKRRTETVA